MDKEALKRCYTYGYHKNDDDYNPAMMHSSVPLSITSRLGRFGVGFKKAAGWLGAKYKVTTKTKGSPKQYSISFSEVLFFFLLFGATF
jgi:hypothetical protein